MKRKLFIILLLLSLFAIGMIYLASTSTAKFETYTTEARLEAPEVRRDRFLVAEYYLKEHAKKPQKMSQSALLQKLDTLDTNTSLIISGDINALSFDQQYQLLEWIAKGGMLIFEPNPNADTEGFLYTFDLELKTDQDSDVLYEYTSFNPAILYNQYGKPLAQINLSKVYDIIPFDEDEVDTREFYAVNKIEGDNHFTSLYQVAYGNGSALVISSLNLWDNHHIDSFDNAWFLNAVTHDHVIFTHIESPTTFNFKFLYKILQNMPATVVLLFLFIALLLWHLGMRSGPIKPIQVRHRRSLSEFVTALATFTQKEQGYVKLLTTLQEDIDQQMRLKSPLYTSLSREDQNRKIASLTQIELSHITSLMAVHAESQSISTLQFIKWVVSLQKLRNQL